MAETRSQTQLRELEDTITTRVEQLLEARLGQIPADHVSPLVLNARLEQVQVQLMTQMEAKLGELYEAVKLMAGERVGDPAVSTRRSEENRQSVSGGLGPTVEEPRRRETQPQQASTVLTRLSKIEFPKFTGDDVNYWIFKCEQFFEVDQTPDNIKVSISVIHLESRAAAAWAHAYLTELRERDERISWSKFKRVIVERFGETIDDPLRELKKLHESSNILDYTEKFEDLRNRVKLTEPELLSLYLAGLREDTECHVRMFRPETVRECFALGKLYEAAKQSKQKPYGGSVSRTWSNQRLVGSKDDAKLPEKPLSQRVSKEGARKFLTNAEMMDRKAKGLCYYCDEKYSPEHFLKHKTSQLFVMEAEEDQHISEANESTASTEEDKVLISLNAIAGITACSNMKVKAMVGKRPLYVLLDTGSTHNFIDEVVAEKLGCKLQPMDAVEVVVADGTPIRVTTKVEHFTWKFQDQEFSSNFMIIPLGNCDMVLGCLWLKTLGEIRWNLEQMTMKIDMGKRWLVLDGIRAGLAKEVKGAKLAKLSNAGAELALLSVRRIEEAQTVELCSVGVDRVDGMEEPALVAVLARFCDLFEEPVLLPPHRPDHDHRIPLLTGANPVNQRPYRYAIPQKNEIDRLVQEMLETGVIRESHSAFGAPVVLVKKKDGSWRLCVDYRKINAVTVKDKFPIPLIEDLLDELGNSRVYSKIDLRSGYHQVRMNEDDIHKTAFKTHSGHYEYVVMPFGLSNAPATFQYLMNSVFRPYLRKFVLIFFDDILIYSQDKEAHVQHLALVFELMRKNRLFANRKKCSFLSSRVEYLGHFLSADGVATDPTKISAVAAWPVPVTVRQLRGFLGLAGYYRRFVKNFGVIARPLSDLTKKTGFLWNSGAQQAFNELKQALCEAPVLALPRFDRPFLVETDACGYGIGAVLMQDHHPIAYISKQLKGRQLTFSIYEKELLAVIYAVQKWRHYLLNGRFILKTDQRSLKYLLEQRLNTPVQQQYLPKLLEFDYEIQYKEGKENLAADALSRIPDSVPQIAAVSILESDFILQIQSCYTTDLTLQGYITALTHKPDSVKHYTWSRGLLRRKGKLVVGNDQILRRRLLEWLHNSGVGGHSGRDVTYHRVKGLFYWKGMAKDINNYIRSCTVCQQCKYETVATPGLLQPLPIPTEIWSDVSMDFIDGLPMSFGKSVILVVVDRLSKAAHFIALSHPYTAFTVAQAYLDFVFKLHGLPQSIVSDRDSVFLSEFWKELFTLQGVALNYSSAYHPQSDGQTEVVNRCLETYLRCMSGEKPQQWSKWLSLAEYWYNTNYHTTTHITPFEAVYGRLPPQHLPYLPGESKVAVVAQSLQAREEMIKILQFYLLRAQHRMEQTANRLRTDRSYLIGDLVYVKLQPYRQKTLANAGPPKLHPKYYGPFKVIDKIGEVAYQLELPASAQIHPVFHISQLKKHVGEQRTSTVLPQSLNAPTPKTPAAILERRTVNRRGRAATKILVHWEGQPIEEATWEFFEEFSKNFPEFQP